MDDLGQRIVTDRATIADKRSTAADYDMRAQRLRREADEIERLLNLKTQSHEMAGWVGRAMGQHPRYGAPNDPSIRR